MKTDLNEDNYAGETIINSLNEYLHIMKKLFEIRNVLNTINNLTPINLSTNKIIKYLPISRK